MLQVTECPAAGVALAEIPPGMAESLSPEADVILPPPVPVSLLRVVTVAGGVTVASTEVRAAQYDSSVWPGAPAKGGVVSVAVVVSFVAPTADCTGLEGLVPE
jgi:hypothetical protein